MGALTARAPRVVLAPGRGPGVTAIMGAVARDLEATRTRVEPDEVI